MPAAAAIAVVAASAYAANRQASAAKKAANTQADAAQAGIDEQRRQFDATQELLKPWVTNGTTAQNGQNDLLGLNGPEAQSAAIKALQDSPQFSAIAQQGEDAILANASATGGLRGGNTQAALAQFRPGLLSQLIDQQYGRLAGVSAQGLNAATRTGQFGQAASDNVSNLLQQQGAAVAGGQIAAGRGQAGYANAIANGIGMYYGGGAGGGAFSAYDTSGYPMTRPGINLPTRGGF